jgi:hypothetical protein
LIKNLMDFFYTGKFKIKLTKVKKYRGVCHYCVGAMQLWIALSFWDVIPHKTIIIMDIYFGNNCISIYQLIVF